MQWLESVTHLHSDITKFLSSTTSIAPVLPSSAKPTASVMPQVYPSSVTTTTETATEIPAAMETETDETASAETSEANLSIETVSKESHDTSLSDVDQLSSGVVPDANLTSSSAAAVCCESNCCEDVTDTVQTVDDCSRGDDCHSDSCRSDSVVFSARTDMTRCSDYEAASVLSDMQQLANIAMAAITGPTPSISLNTSDTRSTSLDTVSCRPALPSLSASCSTSMLGLASSGECARFISQCLILCIYLVKNWNYFHVFLKLNNDMSIRLSTSIGEKLLISL